MVSIVDGILIPVTEQELLIMISQLKLLIASE